MAAYWMLLAVAENTLFALVPISLTVPITITRITASMTAYSATSCPSSLRHKSLAKCFILDSFGLLPIALCALVSQIRMAVGNIFSLSYRADAASLENAGIFEGGVRSEQDDCLRVVEFGVPIGVEKQGLGQRAGWGHQDHLHLPVLKNVSPAGAEFRHCLDRLAEQFVSI